LFREIGGSVLGILGGEYRDHTAAGIQDKLMDVFIGLRKMARSEKNFPLSDKIRDDLKKIGVVLEDTKDGTSWKLE
jgi:cysteinyl-tRNA synthetase